MKVGAFVVTHNHAETLPACLGSLTFQGEHLAQVVVVDNASQDGSCAVAERFASALPIKVLANSENTGFSTAANLALRELTTPWALSLNPDCRLAPGFLGSLLKGVESYPKVGAATGLIMRGSGAELAATHVVDSAGMVMSASGRHFDRGSGKPLSPRYQRPLWVFGASGACALYCREALEDVAYAGGQIFDEAFFAYREDADLAWRLQRRGWRCLYWPEAQAFHRRGFKPEKGRNQSAVVNYHSVRNRFLLRLANADWRWHVGCFPWWLWRDVLVVLGCLTVERRSRRALGEVLRHWTEQRQKGAHNATRARVSSWQLVSWFYPWGRVRELEPCASPF